MCSFAGCLWCDGHWICAVVYRDQSYSLTNMFSDFTSSFVIRSHNRSSFGIIPMNLTMLYRVESNNIFRWMQRDTTTWIRWIWPIFVWVTSVSNESCRMRVTTHQSSSYFSTFNQFAASSTESWIVLDKVLCQVLLAVIFGRIWLGLNSKLSQLFSFW